VFACTTFLIILSFLKERERLSNSRSTHSTRAAFNLRNTIRVLTDKLALRLRASWLMTFPITSRLFTYSFTFRFRCLAVSDAMRLLANSNTFWAIKHFTSLVRTFNFALRLFTLYIADRVSWFRTACVAFGWFAYWIANCRAVRVIAFPRALWMALNTS
jgi:hypothetical protein